MSNSSQKPRRGRPQTFSQLDRENLAILIGEHGIRGTSRLVPFHISTTTLAKIARESGIVMARGKRIRRSESHQMPSAVAAALANLGMKPASRAA